MAFMRITNAVRVNVLRARGLMELVGATNLQIGVPSYLSLAPPSWAFWSFTVPNNVTFVSVDVVADRYLHGASVSLFRLGSLILSANLTSSLGNENLLSVSYPTAGQWGVFLQAAAGYNSDVFSVTLIHSGVALRCRVGVADINQLILCCV